MKIDDINDYRVLQNDRLSDNIENIHRNFMKYLCFRENGVYPMLGTPTEIVHE